jgi:hypothetical protein
LSGPGTENLIGFPFRSLAAEAGVLFPDEFVHLPGVGSRQVLLDAIADLKPGVTEAYLHPAVSSPELEAMATDWEARVDDHRLLVHDRVLRDALDEAQVKLIGYRPLRDLMRAAP